MCQACQILRLLTTMMSLRTSQCLYDFKSLLRTSTPALKLLLVPKVFAPWSFDPSNSSFNQNHFSEEKHDCKHQSLVESHSGFNVKIIFMKRFSSRNFLERFARIRTVFRLPTTSAILILSKNPVSTKTTPFSFELSSRETRPAKVHLSNKRIATLVACFRTFSVFGNAS